MSDLESKYGPSWKLVAEYLQDIPKGFLFERMGQRDPADAKVTRIYEWDEFRAAVHYGFEGADQETCPYLVFLSTCHKVQAANEAIGEQHGLHDQLVAATCDAGDTYADEVAGNESAEYMEFIYSVEREYYWAASVQHHCSYIATEITVAQLTDVHLMRDMWYWYRAGHWPCGWEGTWPEGKLTVF